jgi:hypothetical protein
MIPCASRKKKDSTSSIFFSLELPSPDIAQVITGKGMMALFNRGQSWNVMRTFTIIWRTCIFSKKKRKKKKM